MQDSTQAFLTVCDLGSFLAAGQWMGVATSTVSRRISQLETHLGTQLFLRSTRGLELTEAGRLYRDGARVASDQLSRAEDAVRVFMHSPAGRLRVAAPSGMLRTPLGKVALDYLRTYPDVSLEVVGTDEDVVPDGETLHLAIRVSRTPPPPEIKQVRLGEVEMCLCASPGWRRANPPLVDPDALRRIACVVLGGATDAARVRFLNAGEVRSFTVPIALFTTNIAMARQAGLRGAGPVGLPRVACEDLLATGELDELLPTWTLAPVPVVALYAGNRRLPLRVRSFLDLLKACFGVSRIRKTADEDCG